MTVQIDTIKRRETDGRISFLALLNMMQMSGIHIKNIIRISLVF